MNTSFSIPNAPRMVSSQGNKAVFVIGGFYPGYGVTLANAIRRVILSSLPGAAVIAVKIKGVDHEFSAIPGVLEDVIQILLQIKQMRFHLDEEGLFEGHLKIKGEKEVVAGDFKVPSEIRKIENPDLPIATITDKKTELEITIWISNGIGYKLSQEHEIKPSIQSIGVLKIDSVFTPVIAASFEVEDMRVGERTDYNRVKFSVETDGTITPTNAFESAISILLGQIEAMKHVEGEEDKAESKKMRDATIIGDIENESAPKKIRDIDKESLISSRYFLAHLKLSSRIEKILKKHRIKTIGQLLQKKEEDLLQMEGIGEAAVKEIRRKLGKSGFLLGKVK